MLEFKEIEIDDAQWIKPILAESGFNGSEYSFSSNFIWRKVYNTHVCNYKGFYIAKSGKDDCSFVFPAGKGDYKDLINKLKEYCESKGKPLVIHMVNKDNLEILKGLYGDEIEIGTNRDDYDYVYNMTDLTTLRGKKYSSKRNHINRFIENNWSFEPITEDNIEECIEMNKKWCEQNDCHDDESKRAEACAVKQAFKHYFDLNMEGGLLRVDNNVVAYTIGDSLNDDTYLIHIEKALSDYQGAYPTINKEFALYAAQDYKYINREDDAGSEGLRKAKLSYKPAFLLEKYWVKFL